MKDRRKIIGIIGIVLVVGALLGHFYRYYRYEVYYTELNESYFRKYDISGMEKYEFPESTTPDIEQEDMVLNLGGKEVPFKYSGAIKFYHEPCSRLWYENMSHLMFLTLLYPSMMVESISFGYYEYYITETAFATEKELLSSCEKLLGEYQRSVEGYEPSVETYTSPNERLTYPEDEYDHFCIPEVDSEHTVMYRVKYTRYIDGFRTGDVMTIRLTSTGRVVELEFGCPDTYEDFYGLNIDEKAINKTIDRTVKKMCTIDGFELIDYEASKVLGLIEGDLYLHVSVTPEFEYATEEIKASSSVRPFRLLIPIKKGKPW